LSKLAPHFTASVLCRVLAVSSVSDSDIAFASGADEAAFCINILPPKIHNIYLNTRAATARHVSALRSYPAFSSDPTRVSVFASRDSGFGVAKTTYAIPAAVIGNHSTACTTNANASAMARGAPNSMRPDIAKKSKVPTYPGELGISVDNVPDANANH